LGKVFLHICLSSTAVFGLKCLMVESIPFLISGVLFGAAAGISPGPLLTLVISETLRHGKREGVIVACAPLVTDVPIVCISVFILAKLLNFSLILGIISLLGAAFIAYLAFESLAIKSVELNLGKVKAQSFKKGILTNLLSPHPYLFWITIGAPFVLKGYRNNLLSALFFLLGFYLFLVGSKIMIALIVDNYKSFLKSTAYVYIMRILGLILLVFSGIFLKDGLNLLGILQ
jgi:threonine/homoserine/homoserine lactone efflux protein